MSPVVHYEEENIKLTDAFDLLCKCGHKLSRHGFVHVVSVYPGACLRVSQCCMCDIVDGKFVCPEFELENKNDTS